MLKSDADRNVEQREHLAQVQALAQAMRAAIAAIEKNDLAQFQAHLAAQETICNRLSCGPETASRIAKAAVSGEKAEPGLHHEIRQAYVALAQMNRVYGSLLKRARKSVEMMIALYRSHGTGYDRGPAALPQSRTWSCEA
jgi:hypothetical protein